MKLVVVGSVGLDDVETPFGKVERALGGSATYFSLSASYFARTGFVGVVGNDWPEEANTLLASRGVDLAGLERADGLTFRWAGRYGFDLNSRDTLLTELNVFADFNPVLPDNYRSAKYLFLGNIHPELQLRVLEQSTAAEFVALDTMNFWISGTPEPLRRVLSRVHGLLINDSEARQLSGETNIVSAARAIAAMGPSLIIIKRGEYGALVYREGEFFFVPGYPLENVIDPTGAGDSFAGGFMGYIAARDDLRWSTLCQAMVAGSTVASFCVEGFSVDRLRTLTLSEISQRAARFRALTDFTPLPTEL
jgi:sugar/nucleoside kinase (ribokinase family)